MSLTAARSHPETSVRNNTQLALAVLALVIAVVVVDVLVFKGHFWPRLLANIGIVLVFIAFYLRFLRKA